MKLLPLFAFFFILHFWAKPSSAQFISSQKFSLHYIEQNYQTHLNINLYCSKFTEFKDTVYYYRFRPLNRRPRVWPISSKINSFLMNENQLGIRCASTCFGLTKDFHKIDIKSYPELDSVIPIRRYIFNYLTVQDMVSPFPNADINVLKIHIYNRDKELSLTAEYAHGIGFLRMTDHEKNKDFRLTHIDNIPLTEYVKEKENEIKDHLLSLKLASD